MNSQPPPPYTPLPGKAQTTTIEEIRLRLGRFFIDSVAFVYNVDHAALLHALSTTSFAPTQDFKVSATPKATRPTILSQTEQTDILRLALLVRETCQKAWNHQFSLILDIERKAIYSHVSVPASELGIAPGYALNLLRLYASHQGTDIHKAGHYLRRSSIPLFGWTMQSPLFMAKRLVSDDNLVTAISPNEQTRLLLGRAIASFREKHLTLRQNIHFDYPFYASTCVGILWDFLYCGKTSRSGGNYKQLSQPGASREPIRS
jgi:hypothetical protein